MSLAPPVDWLLVDGLRFRSVRTCADALREWEPLPGELTILGDWYAPFADAAWRAEIQRRVACDQGTEPGDEPILTSSTGSTVEDFPESRRIGR
jgi:hypothetical protein